MVAAMRIVTFRSVLVLVTLSVLTVSANGQDRVLLFDSGEGREQLHQAG
jgi:hypothetical protein